MAAAIIVSCAQMDIPLIMDNILLILRHTTYCPLYHPCHVKKGLLVFTLNKYKTHEEDKNRKYHTTFVFV